MRGIFSDLADIWICLRTSIILLIPFLYIYHETPEKIKFCKNVRRNYVRNREELFELLYHLNILISWDVGSITYLQLISSLFLKFLYRHLENRGEGRKCRLCKFVVRICAIYILFCIVLNFS